jgi:hypothetical protein
MHVFLFYSVYRQAEHDSLLWFALHLCYGMKYMITLALVC